MAPPPRVVRSRRAFLTSHLETGCLIVPLGDRGATLVYAAHPDDTGTANSSQHAITAASLRCAPSGRHPPATEQRVASSRDAP